MGRRGHRPVRSSGLNGHQGGQPGSELDAHLVAGLHLPRPQPGRTTENRAILQRVEAAIAKAGDKPYVTELRQFRLALVLLEGKPEEVLPLLEPMLASDDPRTRQWATLKQVDVLLVLGRVDEAAKRLEKGGAALEKAYPGETACYRGRILGARGEQVAAALEFMRVPILYASKDRERTAEALWRAGQAMAAAGMPADEVAKVYQEAVRDYPGTAGAESAEKELAKTAVPTGRD